MNKPTVEIIQRVESMPYWPAYSKHIAHLNECDTCGGTMPVNGQNLAVLCLVGLALQEQLRTAINDQSALATLS